MTNSQRQEEVVVVTGASAGVGRAVVRRFAQEGAHIGLIARGLDGLEGARNDVEALGGKAIICQTDVSDPKNTAAFRRVFDEALNTNQPALIEAVVDPFEPPMPPKVSLDQAAKFAESLIKGTPNTAPAVCTRRGCFRIHVN